MIRLRYMFIKHAEHAPELFRDDTGSNFEDLETVPLKEFSRIEIEPQELEMAVEQIKSLYSRISEVNTLGFRIHGLNTAPPLKQLGKRSDQYQQFLADVKFILQVDKYVETTGEYLGKDMQPIIHSPFSNFPVDLYFVYHLRPDSGLSPSSVPTLAHDRPSKLSGAKYINSVAFASPADSTKESREMADNCNRNLSELPDDVFSIEF
jgi:hypothetical protein